MFFCFFGFGFGLFCLISGALVSSTQCLPSPVKIPLALHGAYSKETEEGKEEFRPWEGISALVAMYLEHILPGLITLGKFHVQFLGKTSPKPVLYQFPGIG